MSNVRAIAIYLPQFHPIPENDAWWGKGFTEWTNVVKAAPRFKTHYQPHLPADLGFYDLRVPEVREAQAQLARQYGIHAFCYYHYWFNGRRVLERPFNEVLQSGKPDFPFCLCWANENWTRNWDGRSGVILLEQQYNAQDDLDHIRSLCPVFQDDRYLKIDGKPVFIVYRTELFPDMRRTAECWRKAAVAFGFPDLYLIRAESFKAGVDPASIGFDAALEFQPDWRSLPPVKPRSPWTRALVKLGLQPRNAAPDRVVDYGNFVRAVQSKPKPAYKCYPGVTPMWDNTARRRTGAHIFHDSTPAVYEQWLRHTVSAFRPYSGEENLLFINAWNEWAEGNHLEPCQKWGRQYLEATQRALEGQAAVR